MSEANYTKLELTFEPSSSSGYRLSMGYRVAGKDTDQGIPPVEIPLQPDGLKDLIYDIDAYSKALTAQVFAQETLRTQFALAHMLAQYAASALRIQIVISPDAPALHGIMWEALRDPQTGALLSTSENIWFSRYVLSQEGRQISLLPKTELKALGVAANPSDLASNKLAPVDADGEIGRLQQSLAGIPLVSLGNSQSPRATLNNLLDAARAGMDVIYLACHGVMTDTGPVVYLENDKGQMDRMPATRFVASLAEIEKLPRLIVLASCESAGTEDPDSAKREVGALAALGPRLAEIGVPAVLAMHGKISMTTISLFMPAFFKELSVDGQVDRALSVARSLAHNNGRADAWMPVLFSRSISGRLWPDASQSGPTAAQMEKLINEVQSLKDHPGGISIQGENISIQGGVTMGSVVEQAAAQPTAAEVEAQEKETTQPFHLDMRAMLASTSHLEPGDLRGMPRKFIHLQEFIDRIDEYQQFTKMIVNKVDERDKRIVAFYGQAGMGKSWLIDRIEFECVRNAIPCARLNFEKENYNNVIEIMRALALDLGKNEFNRWVEKDDFWHSPAEIKLDINTGEQAAGAGAHLDIENASISDGVVLGTKVDMRGSQFNVGTRAANDPRAAQTALTEMFLSVLEGFVSERPAVLLFEGLDHEMCSAETRIWLIDTLLNRARDLEGYGVLPVVTFFDRPRFERSLEFDTYESQLKPLQIKHIIEYFRMRKIPENIVEPAAIACFNETQGIPAKVYEHSELLISTLDEVLREAENTSQVAAPVQDLSQEALTTPAAVTIQVVAPAQPEPVVETKEISAPEMPAPESVASVEPVQAASQVDVGVSEPAQPAPVVETKEISAAEIPAPESVAATEKFSIPEIPAQAAPQADIAAPAPAQPKPVDQTEKISAPKIPAPESVAPVEPVQPLPAPPPPPSSTHPFPAPATPEENPEAQTVIIKRPAVEETKAALPPTLKSITTGTPSNDEALRRSLDKIQRLKEEGKSSLESMVDHALEAQSPLVVAAAKRCAVLRWFNLEMIGEINAGAGSDQTAEAILARMLAWPFVQELNQGRHAYRDEVRKNLRETFRKEDPQAFRATLERAHAYFDRQLAGINVFSELIWGSLTPQQVNALREKLYFLLQLDVRQGFDLLNSLFLSAQHLYMNGEASTLLRFAQELDPSELPDLYKNRLSYYEAVLDFSNNAMGTGLQKLNDLLDRLGRRPLDGELKAQILTQLGVIINNNRDYPNALNAFEQSQKIWKDLRREQEAARLSNNLGNSYNSQREYDRAEKAFNEALNEFKKVGTLAEQAQALNNLGNVKRNRQDWDEALDFYQKSLSIKHQIGDQAGAARTLVNIGSAYANMAIMEIGGQQVDLRQKALDCLQTGLQTYTDLGARSMQADVLRRLSRLYLQSLQVELAREKLNEAIQLYTSLKLSDELQNPETQSLAAKLGIEIAAATPTMQLAASAVPKPAIATQLLERVISTQVVPAEQPVPVAVPARPIAPPKIDPAQADLQKLETQIGPAVVIAVKNGLAKLNPQAADLAKRGALLRVFDEPLLSAIGGPAYTPDVLIQIKSLPFVQPAPGGFQYRTGERTYLRETLRLENPVLYRETIQRAFQYFDEKVHDLELLRVSPELPPASYFSDLSEKLHYQLKLDQPGGLGLLQDVIQLLVEKTNRLKALQDAAQGPNIKQILNQAALLLAVAREEASLSAWPSSAQDQLGYFEALLDNAGGKPDSAETKLRTLNGRPLENELKGRVLGQLGMLQTNKGDYDAAAKYFEQAQAIWNKLKRDLESARISNNLGNIYLRQTDFERAEKSFQLALAGLLKAGSPTEQAQSLNNLGNVYMQMQNWDKSLDAYQKSLAIKQAAGDQFGMATTQVNLGMVYQRQAQAASGVLQAELRERAVNSYTSAIAIFRGLGLRAQLGRALFALSNLYFQVGQSDKARQTLPEAVRIFKDLGMPELANASNLAERLHL